MPSFITFISEDEIATIANGLANRTLPKAAWTHAAHFAAVLWMLSNRSRDQVSDEFPGLIRAYNEATGVANTDSSGYHETITQASIRAARDFLLQNPERPLFATCNALMASRLGKSDWLLAHWSRERLFSAEARRVWIEPDLEAFPF